MTPTPGAVLDAPINSSPDQDEFVRAAMQWHFSAETGSPFWLERAHSLPFDPRSDVKTFDDLALFPNVADELRGVSPLELIPIGLGPRPDVVAVIESGGTTGIPKRLPLLREFADRLAESEVRYLHEAGLPQEGHWLSLFPSGPHGAFDSARRAAARYGDRVLVFGIDIDPRWVKKQVAAGRQDVVAEYTEHVLDQAVSILQSQDIVALRVTAPILVKLVQREDVVDLMREKLSFVGWGGASLDPDTRYLLQSEIFPEVVVRGAYGTTMALGAGGRERHGTPDEERCIFDNALSPWVTVSVVDPDTGKKVAVGERGQLVVSHVSRSFFLPNNDERDIATRISAPDDQVGDSFADVEPMRVAGGQSIIEGVY